MTENEIHNRRQYFSATQELPQEVSSSGRESTHAIVSPQDQGYSGFDGDVPQNAQVYTMMGSTQENLGSLHEHTTQVQNGLMPQENMAACQEQYVVALSDGLSQNGGGLSQAYAPSNSATHPQLMLASQNIPTPIQGYETLPNNGFDSQSGFASSSMHGYGLPPPPVPLPPPPPPGTTAVSTAPRIAALPRAPSRKRSRDGVESDEMAKRGMASAPHVVFRLLVPPNKVGKIIGRQGMQIKSIREETGAHIQIADALTNMEERVVFISSNDDGGPEKCGAELGLLRVSSLVMEPDIGDREFSALSGGSSNVIRLLICGSQAGGVIGKGGSAITEIRGTSKAKVRVLPQDQISACTSASIYDRLIQISGDVGDVQKALELIAVRLRDNPPSEMITTAPSNYMPAFGPPQVIPGPAFPCGPPAGMWSGAMVPIPQEPQLMGGYMPLPVIPKVTADMRVPSSLIGGVIGKGGTNITQIRQLSGATVKVAGERMDGTSERIIHIEGTSEQVTTAQNLVQAYMLQ